MRTTEPLDEDWEFIRADVGPDGGGAGSGEAEWCPVTLPHSWNDSPDQQANPAYHRGPCWYRKQLHVPGVAPGARVVAEFGAAGSVADVYMGTEHLASHRGGYSIFRVDLTDALDTDGSGSLAVKVDNSQFDDVYPLMGDHTIFGGLYRPAKLIVVDPVHIDLFDHAGPGVVVRQVSLTDETAELSVTTRVANDSAEGTEAVVTVRLLDGDGTEVANDQVTVAAARKAVTEAELTLTVASPRRWDGRNDPHLYQVVTEVTSGDWSDSVTLNYGLRTFTVDADTGAHLNGRPYHLHGVSRHQDVDGTPAVSEADIERDMALIDEIGATAVRLSHYQHAESVLDLCDRLGLLVWAEIPFNARTSTTDPLTNAASQLTELIHQQRHHPSIICWGVQNESTISDGIASPRPNIVALTALAHEIDPDRYVAQANVGHVDPSDEINSLCDLNAANVYAGWYYADAADSGPMLDRIREAWPGVPLGLSEYGADARTEYHSSEPRAGDYTEDYQAVMHEEYWRQLQARPWVWSSFVWNMFDFASAIRNEGGTVGVNMKGLVTQDRRIRKDAFWFYKCRWSTEPVLHVCAKRFVNRHQPDMVVKVYSNQPSVTLLVDGEDRGTLTSDDGIFRWDVHLGDGETTVEARAGDLRDEATFRLVDQPDGSYLCPSPRVVRVGGGPGRIASWFEDAGFERDESLYGVWSTVGELLDEPATREVLVDVFGDGLLEHPMLDMARGLPLEMVLTAAATHLTDDDMVSLHRRLSEVPRTDD
ncbi:MAG: hypothetical protein KDB02_10700 [Acidimicrobiales bacterium]|nr:hypothetical protein [Acidimicrobiales bacterium]